MSMKISKPSGTLKEIIYSWFLLTETAFGEAIQFKMMSKHSREIRFQEIWDPSYHNSQAPFVSTMLFS